MSTSGSTELSLKTFFKDLGALNLWKPQTAILHALWLLGSYYHPNDGTGQIEILDRDIEYAKVHAQVSIFDCFAWMS